ncbi:mannosyltransferase YkcB-related protein [Fodinicola feengrottensis]|uniref:hypothetical protein n=1 Tax=Fodinicola feengrottensis TaxID=435914 RepID=UPI0036F27A89
MAIAGGTTNSALVKLLQASKTRWAAATVGSQEAAPLELSSKAAVMAIGGFSGGDPAPTLAQFQQYVTQNEVHYYIPSNRGGGPAGPGAPASAAASRAGGSGFAGFGRGNPAITSWVTAHFKPLTVGGETVYDLTQPAP